MAKQVFPNTFLIGVQKAGTTTLDDWLSQHPDIFCFNNIKDINLFYRYKTREKIFSILEGESKDFKGEKIILQSAVNYIFYPQALESIASYSPDAKLLVILRNPVDRAISAYNYFKKRFDEKKSAEEALLYKPLETIGEYSMGKNDFTYIEHGFYYKQITNCFKYFKKEQLLVLDYDELASDPASLSKKIFSFLGVDENFLPDFTPKNVTSDAVKNKFMHRILSKQSTMKRRLVNLALFWLPAASRNKLKMKMRGMNEGKSKNETVKPVSKDTNIPKENFKEIKQKLKPYFKEDLQNLDKLLNTNFYEKWG